LYKGGSATSLVPTWVSANRAESAPTRVEVFTSSGGVGGPLALPPLYNAERESSWIAGLSGLAAVERNGTSFNRENLRAALAAADAWVHVAAHGMTRSDLVGQSGLVLAPSDGGKVPTFISWFEIAESRITAPLVVLNACDLGAPSRDARTPETAFAMALAAAGAPNTVAAMWPVSDSAASVWVPAFYGTMTRERDPAVAVREAQLQLRAGRAYRHPYYWAALVHLTQLERPKRSSR
jgi:CHAT domain-containing protein